MKVLVIEDDAETSSYLSHGLQEAGYTVDSALNGRDGLFLATGGHYGTAVLTQRNAIGNPVAEWVLDLYDPGWYAGGGVNYAAYKSALAADRLARIAAGRQLLGNSHITVSPAARAALRPLVEAVRG